MFVKYYGLNEQPFDAAPAPRFLYFTPSHREAFTTLLFGIEAGRGLMTLIAQPGMGKTTLLLKLFERYQDLPGRALLVQAGCDPQEFLSRLLVYFEIPTGSRDLVEMRLRLNDFLTRRTRDGKRFVLFVDGAESLGEPMLETIRLLSDCETWRRDLLEIVLSGRPSLADQMVRSGLHECVNIHARLEPLSPKETERYIDHRLAVTGYPRYTRGPLFTPEAVSLVAARSAGIPRNINILCDRALNVACSLSRKVADAEVVDKVLADPGLDLTLRDEQHPGPSSSSGPSPETASDSVGRKAPPAVDSNLPRRSDFARTELPQRTAPTERLAQSAPQATPGLRAQIGEPPVVGRASGTQVAIRHETESVSTKVAVESPPAPAAARVEPAKLAWTELARESVTTKAPTEQPVPKPLPKVQTQTAPESQWLRPAAWSLLAVLVMGALVGAYYYHHRNRRRQAQNSSAAFASQQMPTNSPSKQASNPEAAPQNVQAAPTVQEPAGAAPPNPQTPSSEASQASDESQPAASAADDLPAPLFLAEVSGGANNEGKPQVKVESEPKRSASAGLDATMGAITVITEPSGLEVLIDGKSYGPSPAKTDLAPGEHTCTIIGPRGMPPLNRSFVVNSGNVLKYTVSW